MPGFFRLPDAPVISRSGASPAARDCEQYKRKRQQCICGPVAAPAQEVYKNATDRPVYRQTAPAWLIGQGTLTN